MEIKYTTDGKKVVVIGNLNAQEKIVQEVFIINNTEVPSGENFVVKSLHDAPAISWKEKEMERIEKRYQEKQREVESLENNLRRRNIELQATIEAKGRILRNVSEDSFKTLVDYICGNIKWIVKVSSHSPELIQFVDFGKTYERDLRLVSIFGKDDGTLQYAIGQYSDLSGGHSSFMPFTNYQSAFEYFKEQLINSYYSEKTFEQAKKYEITLDREKVEKYKEKSRKDILNNIQSYTTQIEKWGESLEIINKLTLE